MISIRAMLETKKRLPTSEQVPHFVRLLHQAVHVFVGMMIFAFTRSNKVKEATEMTRSCHSR